MYLSRLNHLIRPQVNWGPDVGVGLAIVQNAINQLNYSTEQLMLEVMQPCDHLLRTCVWLRTKVPCNSIFRIAKSAEGFCCSFNYNAINMATR